MKETVKLVVMGGSWGGRQASVEVLQGLPASYSIPIVLVLHRLRNFEGNLRQIYERRLNLKAAEIEEKAPIEAGFVYIAPANYHVLLEKDKTFSLDVSELVNYSRPSIDVTFASAAEAFGDSVTGILLSGASKDGSMGLKSIADAGGTALVQDPAEAEADTMPRSAIELIPDCSVLALKSIKEYLVSLA